MTALVLQGQDSQIRQDGTLSGQLAAVSAQLAVVSGQLAAVSAQIAQVASGQVLEDKSETGKVRPWRERKLSNELLSQAYVTVDAGKAARLRECASWLEFVRYEDGSRRLKSANFCRVRLCPMCQWRRAVKNSLQVRRVVNAMAADLTGPKVYWFLLTLTVRNCLGDELSGLIDRMQDAWKRLAGRQEMREVIGWYRGLEVTHDVNPVITPGMYRDRIEYYKAHGLKAGDDNPNYDTYHPHYHVLLAVPDAVMKRPYAESRERWAAAWQSCLRVDYLPQTDFKRCRIRKTQSGMQDMGGAVAEVAKYACKDADYIVPDDWDLTVDTVRILDKALDKRRLIAYGKECKAWHKRLNLQDVDSESADLVTEDGETGAGEVAAREVYYWYTGYRQYRAL